MSFDTLPLTAHQRAQRVRMLVLDVDGTMTDGKIYIGPEGEALKAFSVHDGFGLSLLRMAGFRLAIITGRQSSIVAKRAAELKFDAVLQGVTAKGDALNKLAMQFALAQSELAFMGDDWPDLPAMRRAGLAACVANAAPEVRAMAHWVSTAPAGAGAVREFAQWLLAATGKLDELHRRYAQSD